MNRSELSRRAMAIAGDRASRKFRRRSDCEELVADARSKAWEIAQTAPPDATPGTVAWFAVKRVSDNRRRFEGSSRSVDHPKHQMRRSGESLTGFSRVGDDPSLIVMAKLDTAAWMQTLTAVQRVVVLLFAAGWRTGEIARVLQRTPARVSQIRDQLRQLWAEFQEG